MYTFGCINNCIYCIAVLKSIYTSRSSKWLFTFKSTVECPRGTYTCKYATAEEHMAKTVVCHFGFTEKVYEPVTESVRKQ